MPKIVKEKKNKGWLTSNDDHGYDGGLARPEKYIENKKMKIDKGSWSN